MVTPSAVVFASPGEIEIQQDPALAPEGNQVLVETRFSAISAGTELLIYRGEIAQDTPLDSNIPALSETMDFPVRYGYSAVGEVVALGDAAPGELLGVSVFAFHPHASHFVASFDDVIILPQGLPLEAALFLPNMETAVNFLHDGAPLVGERAVVLGQGVVGLLTAALLKRIPLESLATVDRYKSRREAARELGVDIAAEPGELLPSGLQADLSYELSGAPEALSEALELTGFGGRIVLGSWYGTKPVPLDLGGRFHRNRITLVGSQVSTLAPKLTGRWDKARRMAAALELIHEIQPERWITHRFPLESAREAYALLAQHPEQALQVVLTYQ